MINQEEDDPPDLQPRRGVAAAECPTHAHPTCNLYIQRAVAAGWQCEARKRGRVIICYPPNGDGSFGFVAIRSDAGDDDVQSVRRQFGDKGLDL